MYYMYTQHHDRIYLCTCMYTPYSITTGVFLLRSQWQYCLRRVFAILQRHSSECGWLELGHLERGRESELVNVPTINFFFDLHTFDRMVLS